jgi:hypothetical protein
MKKLQLIFISVFAISGLFFATSVHAQTATQLACDAADGVYNAASDSCATKATQRSVDSAVKTAVNILSYVAGVASIIMIVIGGIKYAASGGDSNAISSAKNTLLYAVVGLVIALLAQALVRFVFGKAAS